MPGGSRDVTAYLKLDTAEWDAAVDHAELKADELARKSPDVKVKADVADALAKLEAVHAATLRLKSAEARLAELRGKEGVAASTLLAAESSLISSRLAAERAVKDYDAAESKLAGTHDKTASAADRGAAAAKRLRLSWVDAAIALGPGLLPVVGAAAGALLGLGAIGGVAVLAFLGLKNMMADTSAATLPFRTAVKNLNTDLHAMEVATAKGVAPGLTQALVEIQGSMPQVTANVQALSGQLGLIVQHVGPGLVQLLLRLQPLFITVGNELVRGSIAFENWASNSSSVNSFVNYAEANLPKVISTLSNLIQLIAKIGSGLGGSYTFSGIALLAKILNGFPLPVLQAIGPAVIAARAAFLGWQGINVVAGGLEKLGTKIPLVASALEAIPFGPTGAAVAGVGLAIGGVIAIIDHFRHHTHDAIQAVSDLTQAILQDGDALKTNTRQWLVNALQQKGAYDMALQLGISQKTLTDALLGNGKALDTVSNAMDKAQNQGGHLGNVATQLGKVTDGLTGQLIGSKQAADNEAAAMGNAAGKAVTLKSKLDSIAPFKTLTINVKDNASAQLGIIQANIEALHNKQIDIYTYVHNVILPSLNAPGAYAGPHAAGGLIGGIGTGTSDSNIIRVSKGEFVMPADVTMGNLAHLEALRSMSATNPSSTGGYAGGGWTGGGDTNNITVVVNVSGSVVTEKQLVRTVQQGIREDLRRRGKMAAQLL